ncbi:hypothetical protein [Pseudomonas sichuanensis]|uniref:hypothetical protein n=1 Tax=Pseudomonas TaxID=286 RepID=UPI0036DFA79C
MNTVPAKHGCIMAVNAGSSSIKTSIFHGEQRIDININFIGLATQTIKIRYHELPNCRNETYSVTVCDNLQQAAAVIMEKCSSVLAELNWPAPKIVGHRVKFSGFGTSVEPFTRKNQMILAFNDYLSSRHNTLCLAVLRESCALYPDAQQLMVRDQAVSTLSLHKEATVPFAHDIIRRYGLYAHGYHGLAIKACLQNLAETHDIHLFNGVICQIGSGVSFSKVDAGKIVYNSMQFSACDGPIMHNRSGTQPPGLILRLLKYGLKPHLLSSLYNRRSGIYGLADLSPNSTTTVEEILCQDQFKDAKESYLTTNAIELFKTVTIARTTSNYVFSGGLTNKHRWLGPELLYRAHLINANAKQVLITKLENPHASHASHKGTSIYIVDIDEQLCILKECLDFESNPTTDFSYQAICEVPGTSIGILQEGQAGWGNSHICLIHPNSDFPFDPKDFPEAFIFHGPDRDQFFMRAAYARRYGIPAIFIAQGEFTPNTLINKKIYLDTPTTTVVPL